MINLLELIDEKEIVVDYSVDPQDSPTHNYVYDQFNQFIDDRKIKHLSITSLTNDLIVARRVTACMRFYNKNHLLELEQDIKNNKTTFYISKVRIMDNYAKD